ncbi:MAG TPA: DUF2252 domain-containing protein [Acidimicrobiia bacterium]|nr:DUF2252 domain-containing protein [Acidimicrobiia bacterium]
MTSPAGRFTGVDEGLSAGARAALGRAARDEVPPAALAAWVPPPDRDPIGLIESQAATRVPELVPLRHARMAVSPFTYFRGAALPMAADLASTPGSGLTAQLCGDAHLANFGFFASPERHLTFDVNDFDETAPGPFEWDVKRLAASLEIGGRDDGFTTKDRGRIVRHAVRSYREAMREFASLPILDVWYAHLDIDDLLPRFHALLDERRTPSVWASIVKARAHDSLQAFEKLCHVRDGEPRIVREPPLIVPIEDFVTGSGRAELLAALEGIVESYMQTLQHDRRHLLGQYRFVDLARKVVGVGSVGTATWIALLVDRADDSPLFLQVKEAQPSVLERFTSASTFENHGERVVAGQRLIQAASDIFLGWDRVAWDGIERDYYLRQLRDWKGSADVAGMTVAGMELWGRMCGWTLARAHARTGDRLAIAAYLGKSDTFERAIADFAAAYADQNERDYGLMVAAIASGRLAAATPAPAKRKRGPQ